MPNHLLEKYHLTKWFNRKNLIVMILIGVLLVIIVLPVESTEQNIKSSEQRSKEAKGEAEEEKLQYGDSYEYADYLERELEDILTKIKGVGNVKVMITMEGSKELIVHQDEKFVCSDSSETDSKGGSRTVQETDMQGQTIYEKTDIGESPYVVQTKLPKVSGVLIVAEGAGDGSIKKCITEIAQALLNVAAHKVTVVTME